MNALDLDPEWGAIDLVEEIESTFGIKISDAEAERCITVGDLYNLITTHASDWDLNRRPCGSSAIFYMLRAALPFDRGMITPSTLLKDLGGDRPRKLFKRIREKTDLRLPTPNLTRLGLLGFGTCFIATIAFFATLAEGSWAAVGLSLVAFAMGIAPIIADPLRLPPNLQTVGDLVRRTAALNAGHLRLTGRRPPDAWTTLVGLAAEHSTLHPDEVRPDTFLMASLLKSEAVRR